MDGVIEGRWYRWLIYFFNLPAILFRKGHQLSTSLVIHDFDAFDPSTRVIARTFGSVETVVPAALPALLSIAV